MTATAFPLTDRLAAWIVSEGIATGDLAVQVAASLLEDKTLTTPRPEGPGFRWSPAGVPVSPAPAPGNVRSRGPQPKSYSTSAGIGTTFGTYGTTCRICLARPSYAMAFGEEAGQ